MNPASIGNVARVLTARSGIALDGTMRHRLERCLGASAHPGMDIDQYARLVLADPAELHRVVECLTIQESSFFRDPKQFDAFADIVLPDLTPPVRIWSCGCARGQEPYSLAMVLAEVGRPDASVIATDISTRALAAAADGVYPESALTGLTPERRSAWLVPEGRHWSIHPDVRRRVSFAPHNLAVDPPPFPPGQCQVIFCRNVLIYFGHKVLIEVLARIRDWLPPGGRLFLGYSESLWRVTDMFELERIGGAFVYRRPGPATRPAPAVAPPASGRPERVPARPSRSVQPLPEVAPLLAQGELAMAAGDLDAAIALLRRATYVDSSQPLAHFELGMALDAQGHPDAARRAFRVALTALRCTDSTRPPAWLAGYRLDTLAELIEAKLGGRP